MNDDDDIEGLAAEYVLGSLDPKGRRAVDARRSREPGLAAAIAGWERWLEPLNGRIAPKAPPAYLRSRVLQMIEDVSRSTLPDPAETPSAAPLTRIARADSSVPAETAALAAEIVALRSSVRKLRTTSWLSMGVAASLFLLLGWSTVMRNGSDDLLVTTLLPSHYSNSADENLASAAVTFVLIANPRTGTLVLQMAAGRVPDGHVYQLWMRPMAGGPLTAVSRINPGQSKIESIIPLTDVAERSNVQLLVSIEPVADTPPMAPTGRILAIGHLPGAT